MATFNLVTDYGGVADGSYAIQIPITLTSGSAVAGLGSAINITNGDFISVPMELADGIVNTTVVSGGGSATTSITLAATSKINLTTTARTLCWGHTDNASKFAAFTAANAGTTPTTLNIPAGTFYCSYGNPLFGISNNTASAVRNLIVNGPGTIAAGILNLGCQTLFQDNAHSARIASVSAGATSITLLNAGLASLFTVGQWALIAGFDRQGDGFPINPAFFDYVLVSGKSGATISFATTPLKHRYSSTWPLYFAGSVGEIDMGGPATIYALFPQFDCNHTYGGGLTIVSDQQFGASGRTINFDGTFTNRGRLGVYPTTSLSWTFSGTAPENKMEIDKVITALNFSGASMFSASFQSASIDLVTISNSTISNELAGTPRNAVISGSTIGGFQPGPLTYGQCDSLVATNSVISTISPGGKTFTNITTGRTMANGVITYTLTGNAHNDALANSWCEPGTHLAWFDNDRTCIRLFQVLTVTADVTNVYVTTTESGGFPTPNSGALGVRVHPCPNVTFTNCSATGPAGTSDNSDAYMLSQAPAGKPLYSYFRRTYDGKANSSGNSELWGNLTSLSMNVSTPYSPSGPAYPNVKIGALGSFNWWTQSGGALGTTPSGQGYIPTIDLTVAGNRMVTVTGGVQSKSGIQAGDTVPDLPAVPFFEANQVFGFMLNDITSGANDPYRPLLTVTLQADQGFPPPTARTFLCKLV